MRVLLADDHPLFVDGLRNLLAAHQVETVGIARDGIAALDQARALRPDLILMDIHMPQLDGLAALRLIKAVLPEIKVVMLTMSAEDEELFEAIKGGACGYLLKTQDTDTFFSQLQAVAHGEVVLSPGLAGRILQEFKRRKTTSPGIAEPGASLTAREMQVLTLVASGLTYKEAGTRLFLSDRTIKYHMAEIVGRLHLENRTQAIDYARRAGLV